MNSTLYIIKKYHHYSGDSRNRGKTEYEALKFLSKYSIKNIPKIHGVAEDYKWIVLEYISGKKIGFNSLSGQIVDQSIKFITEIQKLRNKKEASKIADASEAVFSLTDCFKYIDGRINKMKRIDIKSNVDIECGDFVKNRISETYFLFSNLAKKKYIKEKLEFDIRLETENRILSPSDFGFHNSILGDDGKLYFLDFEYFGWDDPAKLISDFFLQPEFPLPYIYREEVVSQLGDCLSDKESLEFRLPLYYLLFGIKWCLITLNPFVRKGSDESLKKLQFEKSKQLLDHLHKEYAEKIFPLSLL